MGLTQNSGHRRGIYAFRGVESQHQGDTLKSHREKCTSVEAIPCLCFRSPRAQLMGVEANTMTIGDTIRIPGDHTGEVAASWGSILRHEVQR